MSSTPHTVGSLPAAGSDGTVPTLESIAGDTVPTIASIPPTIGGASVAPTIGGASVAPTVGGADTDSDASALDIESSSKHSGSEGLLIDESCTRLVQIMMLMCP